MSGGHLFGRRQVLKAALTPCLLACPLPSVRAVASEPGLNEDGLYVEPWFVQSFLVLSEDLQAATDSGRRFAIMWELKGCPYCRETHLVNFADGQIRGFVQEHFDILQLNFIGSRLVVDFDGEELEEKALARKWGVSFTPTTCFYPEAGAASDVAGKELEVARMSGYFRPPHFLAMYRFVQEKHYVEMDFRAYLNSLKQG